MRSIASLTQINPRAPIDSLHGQFHDLEQAERELRAARHQVLRLMRERAAQHAIAQMNWAVNPERDALLADY